MAYGDFKDLPRRTASDKILRDKAFNIAKKPKYDRYQRGFASMVDKLFDKNSLGGAVTRTYKLKVIGEIMTNHHRSNLAEVSDCMCQLIEELHKPLCNLADMQLISKYNKGFRFLLSVIDGFSKYA